MVTKRPKMAYGKDWRNRERMFAFLNFLEEGDFKLTKKNVSTLRNIGARIELLMIRAENERQRKLGV